MSNVISMVENALTTETRDAFAGAVLDAICRGRWRKGIENIRQRYRRELAEHGDDKKAKEAIASLKKELPGVLWSGQFSRRANEALVKHSGLLCADLDNLGTELFRVREKLQSSPHLWALFESPSGGGLKAIFRVPADVSRHLASYRAVERHVRELTGVQIDQKGKDVARICFVSYDPELCHNPDAIEIEPLPEPKRPARPTASADKPNKQQIRDMLAVIPKRPDYHDWIEIVAAVGDALSDADAVEVLNEWSPEEEQGEYQAKLNKRLKDVHVATLFYLARQHGWQPPKRDDITSLSLPDPDYPEPFDEAAFYALAGDVVRRILPETEADPAALLFTFLTGFGNMIGRTAYMMADGARHHLNLYSVTVGRTSISRKGTAWMRVKPVLELIDEDWVKNNVEQGLSSGEGVIHRIRNKIDEEKPIREKGRWTGEYETVTVDPGIDDKRLLVLETEFCSPLNVMNREGNTLSPVLRAAWDGDDLGTLTKNSRERATEPHLSMLGHITREELRRSLNENEAANGFGNRNLWIASKRSKSLPKGGAIPPIADFTDPLQEALLFAYTCSELRRDAEAEELWAQVYPELSEGKPGLFGAITARAAPQVLRISGLYAVLDCSALIRVPHLKAALACWRYAENSARWIFQTGTGNKDADKILAALRAAEKKE